MTKKHIPAEGSRTLGLTFAGGGNRAFYQLGLMNRWGNRLWPQVAAIASCSAGACVAAFILSGRQQEASDFWLRRRAGVTKNFEFSKLLQGKRPTPHAPIYRDTLLCSFDHGGLEQIQQLPFPFWILTTSWTRLLPAFSAVLLGITAYSLEKKLKDEMIHPSFGRKLGFNPVAFDARSCTTPEQLADLILASSATPPFTPLGNFRGFRLLDGGIVDNAPAFLLDDNPAVTKNLVLLTRPYPAQVLGRQGKRLYLAPSRETPVERWDYTQPDKVFETVAMGETEADQHAPLLEAFLAS
ncbi:MAG: patatin-like phospholipase family protein [Blastocatellia bacterium]|nr:patatin-like phospholipase family protein [Blastocatellia bacterium]